MAARTRPSTVPSRSPHARSGAAARLRALLHAALRVPPRTGRWWAWPLVAAYALQLAVVGARHEPWFDEAQAWLLARDASVWHLVTEQLRYEGSPGLWHLLLTPLAKAGLPYRSMHVLAGAVAVAGAWVLARRAPLPVWAIAGVLASYEVAYQYAVVARSYVLLPLLLFLLADAWPRRIERPGRLTVLLALLANVSLHGLLIAGALAAVHVGAVWRQRETIEARALRRALAWAGGLLAVGLLVVAQLWPPADHMVLRGVGGRPQDTVRAALLTFNSALTGTLALSASAAGVFGWWFARRGMLALWLAPTLALLALSVLAYHNYWHDGIPFLVLLFALWVSLGPGGADRADSWRPAVVPAIVALAVAVVLLVHAGWWVNAARHDLARPYSGAAAAAAHIEALREEDGDLEVWALSFHTLGLLLYLDDNPFVNLRDGGTPSYMHWSREPVLDERRDALLQRGPDLVVWGEKYPWQQRRAWLPGYTPVAYFPGELYWKNRVVERDAFVLLERTEQR